MSILLWVMAGEALLGCLVVVVGLWLFLAEKDDASIGLLLFVALPLAWSMALLGLVVAIVS